MQENSDQEVEPRVDVVPDEQPSHVMHWSHQRVCKYFLSGLCPFKLFLNTQSDIGECSYIHDESLKTQYQDSEEYGTLGYEESFLALPNTLIGDTTHRILRAYERIQRFSYDFESIPDEIRDQVIDVCSVCGKLFIRNDSSGPSKDHFIGLEHIGFIKLRQQAKLMEDNKFWQKNVKVYQENIV
ncbi:Luc7-like protein 3 [Thelohanellus kitauei]|uniref:Luc7-like protein 3 n=1 Tax=Thelohanellus kitauei TaxID=669202 RepID=A0A0C2JSS4_THEKT|nr:Luc7-like protein 3 [Thelohanellus kitauei]